MSGLNRVVLIGACMAMSMPHVTLNSEPWNDPKVNQNNHSAPGKYKGSGGTHKTKKKQTKPFNERKKAKAAKQSRKKQRRK